MSQDISQISRSSSQAIAVAHSNPVVAVPQQKTPAPSEKPKVNVQAADSVAIDSAKVSQNGRFQRIEENMSDKRDVAARVREIDTTLDTVSSHVQAMKANLAKIVKNYPPFAIDSKERMEILRSYVSLRKEIDSMTFPAPPTQQGSELKGAVWQEKGLAGMLPGELASNASDAQVLQAHNQLAGAAQSINEGKQELKRMF